MFNKDKVTYQLCKIPYATIYNFQPWTRKKSDDLQSSLQHPGKIFKTLSDKKIVNKVAVYPYDEDKRNFRKTTFYTLKVLSGGSLSHSQTYNGQIAYDMLRHQSGLMDILLAFINLYPDCLIDIDCKKEFPYKRKIKDARGNYNIYDRTYCPDAFIKLTTPNNKEYHFIIEFERTKSHEQIRKDKMEICNSLNKFGTYGISRHTRFLFFYTYELYNVFARPVEYNNPEIKKYQNSVEYRLNSLINDSQHLLNDNYLFLPFHDFYLLNKPIWLNSKKEKRMLVS